MNILTVLAVSVITAATTVLMIDGPKTPQQRDAIAMERIEASKKDGTITNLCVLIVQTGEYCRCRGHRWEAGPCAGAIVQYGRMWPNLTRHCAICGLTQEQIPGDWK